ncbi:PLP-dependent transferase [Marasmius fiardii PR-910]|nr:PLP-dependent transferase [Marasmius fiardii PR-910]
MTSKNPKPQSVNLSHHLNTLSRSRVPSPLKDIIKYMNEPGMISLAGGLPHPSLFPYHKLHVDVYTPDALNGHGEPADTSLALHSEKYADSATRTDISAALQYTTSAGSARLSSFIRKFTEDVLRPGFSDFEILLNFGNTDAWSKVVSLLCEYGDYILVEEHTYPSSQALWAPMGCRGVPIQMDKDGIVPQALQQVLGGWNEAERRGKRPKLLYVIPVAQNPTGATLTLERKQAIYDICVKYDIIICEDDPYYFLQLPAYARPEQRRSRVATEMTPDELIKSLIPTFLHLDWQGRVIRLETFSKTLAPGNRLGYFICNPVFAERLLRATEVMTQAPAGWSQIIVEELLTTWGQEGFLRWMTGLRHKYAVRRDWMCDSLAELFDVVPAPEGLVDDVVAYPKGRGGEGRTAPFFSFSYPKGGMFLWIKLDLSQNPIYQKMKADGEANAEQKWADEFWVSMIKSKVLLVPGSYYTPILGDDQRMEQDTAVAHFRLAFSLETREDMHVGIQRMARTFEENWELKKIHLEGQ